ncbi:RPA-related protein RADX [Podarcis raffonei]|uniref:RPA-related protein RADX n=1 Tax=Podarcis raffonei TaxID=65483 RepID=UPI0023295348|nr:RPA-related protein RADX [Podarcis raffonei]
MGTYSPERDELDPFASDEEEDVLELWLEDTSSETHERRRNMENGTGRLSWILVACCRAAVVQDYVTTFVAAPPVTVLSLERYLKDASRKTRVSYISASNVSTRASSYGEVAARADTPGPSTEQPDPFARHVRLRPSSLIKAPKRTGFQYLYDMTISDGVYRERCFLAPELNRLVQTNALRCGLRVQITELSCAFVQKFESWIMCIEQLEILGAASRSDAVRGQQLPERRRKPPVPLMGRWKYYLPLWNNEDPYGDRWRGKKDPVADFADDSAVKTLRDLQRDFGHKIGNRIKTGTHPIIIKITHRGRLQYYGKPSLAVDKPYQATFIVADRSGSMTMVLWNDLCFEWYNSMNIGTVLLLENYGVKRSCLFKTQQTLGSIGVKKLFSIELTLNPGQRPAITIIPKDDVKVQWRLPNIQYQFITRSKLLVTPYIEHCDVVGLVKFVGRTQRTRKTEHGEDFLIYRWVLVADGTSDKNLILQLFSSSQPEIFERIHPRSLVVCTHLKVIREIAGNGSFPSYLRTTNESQMFICEWHRGQPYENEVRVRSIIHWKRTQEGSSHANETFIGGYYPLPPAPDTFLKCCETTGVDPVLKTVNEIGEEIGKLHYREHKRIAIRGIIGAVKYVDCTIVPPDASVQAPVQAPVEAPVEAPVQAPVEAPVQAPVEAPEQVSQEPAAGTSAQTSHPPEQQPTGPRKCKAKRKNRIVESDEDEQDASSPAQKKRKRRTSKKKHGWSAKRSPGSWESSLWDKIKDRLEQHLHYSRVFPESFPSKFNYETGDFLMQLCNLQASKYRYVPNTEDQTEYACPYEYYQVTIVGMNRDTAIDVALLPVCYAENSGLLQAAGMEYATVDLPNTSGTSSQKTIAQALSRGGLVRKPVICILDVFSLGEDKVEVFLNKVYLATE